MSGNDTTAIIRVKKLEDAKTILGILVKNDYSVMIEKEEIEDYEDRTNKSVYVIVFGKIDKEYSKEYEDEEDGDDETC